MSQVLNSGTAPAPAISGISSLAARPAYQSYLMLHIGFAVLPIVAGVAFEILKFAGAHRDKAWAMALIAPGLWTQYITTREPDDSQIEVAIKSLQAVWDKEHEAAASGEADVAAAVA